MQREHPSATNYFEMDVKFPDLTITDQYIASVLYVLVRRSFYRRRVHDMIPPFGQMEVLTTTVQSFSGWIPLAT